MQWSVQWVRAQRGTVWHNVARAGTAWHGWEAAKSGLKPGRSCRVYSDSGSLAGGNGWFQRGVGRPCRTRPRLGRVGLIDSDPRRSREGGVCATCGVVARLVCVQAELTGEQHLLPVGLAIKQVSGVRFGNLRRCRSRSSSHALQHDPLGASRCLTPSRPHPLVGLLDWNLMASRRKSDDPPSRSAVVYPQRDWCRDSAKQSTWLVSRNGRCCLVIR